MALATAIVQVPCLLHLVAVLRLLRSGMPEGGLSNNSEI